MPTIPTPFIGGSGAPRQEREASKDIAPPFAPDETAQPAPPAPEPEAEIDEYEIIIETIDDEPELEPAVAAPQPAEPIVAPAEPVTPSEVEAQVDDADMPDFLFGSDSAEDEMQSAQRLAEKAHELLDGEQGTQIRDLIADLSLFASEIAVPRAFAAGYLAAKKEEES